MCLLGVADLPSRMSLSKHLASHLERFSLDCLPLDTSSWGDQNIRDDSSEPSDADQDLRLGHHEHNAHNEHGAFVPSGHMHPSQMQPHSHGQPHSQQYF